MPIKARLDRPAGSPPLRDTRGVAIIELAIVAPVLIAMIIGMSELSTAYSTKLQLEQAAQRTVEKVLNNSISSSEKESLQLEAAQAADVDPQAVDVVYTLNCDNLPRLDPRGSCNPGQLSSRFVTLEISKRYVPMFTTRFLGSQRDGSFMLRGKAEARLQ